MAEGKYQERLEPEKLILLEGWVRDRLTDEQVAKNIGISSLAWYRRDGGRRKYHLPAFCK